jgi:hypothetical protein
MKALHSESFGPFFHILLLFFIRDRGKPQTPYQGLIKSDKISDQKKVALRKKHESLNPVYLAKKLAEERAAFFKLVQLKEEQIPIHKSSAHFQKSTGENLRVLAFLISDENMLVSNSFKEFNPSSQKPKCKTP